MLLAHNHKSTKAREIPREIEFIAGQDHPRSPILVPPQRLHLFLVHIIIVENPISGRIPFQLLGYRPCVYTVLRIGLPVWGNSSHHNPCLIGKVTKSQII